MPFDPKQWQGRIESPPPAHPTTKRGGAFKRITESSIDDLDSSDLQGGLLPNERASIVQPAPGDYEPERWNPLRLWSDQIAACFTDEPRRHGVVVVELAYADSGAVTEATAHGALAPATRTCLASTAKQAKRIGSDLVRQRCSLAYGTLPIGEAPGIDLAGDAIAWHGKRVATADGAETSTVDALRQAVTAASVASTEPVVVHGPIVIRPTDTTTMRVVNMTMRSVIAAGERNFVFAATQGATWRSLSALELPVIPVPAETGAPWMNPELGGPPIVSDEVHVQLSMLVTTDAVTIRLSRVNDIHEIRSSKGVHDWAKVVEALIEVRKSAWYGERPEIQIAGTGDVPYKAVVDAIDRAQRVGFTAWALLLPDALATPMR